MNLILSTLGRLRRLEYQLAEGFRDLARRHADDYDLVRGCNSFANASEAHVLRLEDILEELGVTPDEESHRALFQGQATESALFWDLEDMLILAQEARAAWMELEEVAEILESSSVSRCIGKGSADLDQSIGWLQSQIRSSAPMSLVMV